MLALPNQKHFKHKKNAEKVDVGAPTQACIRQEITQFILAFKSKPNASVAVLDYKTNDHRSNPYSPMRDENKGTPSVQPFLVLLSYTYRPGI